MVDHWIINELNEAIADIGQKVESYRFAEASEAVYHIIWDSVADWFIEASKLEDNPSMLAWVLDTSLKLAHPFAPFVTETIWQTLSWHDDLLITSLWPEKTDYDAIAAAEFNRLKKLIVEARFVMAELPGNERYDLLYRDDSLIADNIALIQKLAKLKDYSLTACFWEGPFRLETILSGYSGRKKILGNQTSLILKKQKEPCLSGMPLITQAKKTSS